MPYATSSTPVSGAAAEKLIRPRAANLSRAVDVASTPTVANYYSANTLKVT